MFASLLCGLWPRRPPDQGVTSSRQHSENSALSGDGATLELNAICKALSGLEGNWLQRTRNAALILRDLLHASVISIAGSAFGANSYAVLFTATADTSTSNDDRANIEHIGLPQSVSCTAGEVPCSWQHVFQKQGALYAGLATPLASLPRDWLAMHDAEGMTEFACVPIVKGHKLLGALSVARGRSHGGSSSSGRPQWRPEDLEQIALFIGQCAFQNDEPLQAVALVASVAAQTDIDSMVRAIAWRTTEMVRLKAHLPMACRVALIHQTGLTAAVFEEVPVFARRRSSTTPSTSTIHAADEDEMQLYHHASYGHLPSSSRASWVGLPLSNSTTREFGGPHNARELAFYPSYQRLDRQGTDHSGMRYSMQLRPIFTSTDFESTTDRLLSSGPASSSYCPVGAGVFHATPITLQDTLLAKSLLTSQGQYVSDCTSYLNDPLFPSRDLVISKNSRLVSALVHTAYKHQGTPLMALYLTYAHPLPASLLADMLAELQALLQLLGPQVAALLGLHGPLSQEWSVLHDDVLDPDILSGKLPHASSREQGTRPSPSTEPPAAVSCSLQSEASEGPSTPGGTGTAGTGSHRPASNMSFRVVQEGEAGKIESMLLGLHSRLSLAKETGLMKDSVYNRHEELSSLVLLEEIGQGGYGTVYRSMYNSMEVAVKVVLQTNIGSGHALGHIRDALELAVVTAISHPCIVQIVTFYTDVVVVPARMTTLSMAAANGLQGSPAQPGIELLPSDAGAFEGQGQRALVLCMEYCDEGSLLSAINRGVFKQKVKGGFGATVPNMQFIYRTLLEVAVALRHLHSLLLVHCDLKPSNILLKSNPRDPRGFVTKLSDFGLVNMLVDDGAGNMVIRNVECYGTSTHMAPEVIAGGMQDTAIDVYSFGILMWELLTGLPVYCGMRGSEIRERVLRGDLRPKFPSYLVPDCHEYKELAEQCWAADPTLRPSSAQLVEILKRHMTAKGISGMQSRHGSSTIKPGRPSSAATSSPPDTTLDFPVHIL